MSKPGSATSTRRDEGKEPHQRRGLILQRYSEYIDSIGCGDERQRREDVLSTIKNFLNLVATPAKFITDDFLEFFSGCIDKLSASTSCSDMDCLIAAFFHLEDFSLRLLKEPWRPEFRLLKLYNNLFVTSILPFLTDAPKIFTSLGYVRDSSQSETLMLLPSSPLDVKAVSAVACDLLLAASELSIIKTVLATLQSLHITIEADETGSPARSINIHDVWKERKLNVGSAASSVGRISDRSSSSSSSSSRHRDKANHSPSPSRYLDSSDIGPLPRFPSSGKSRDTSNIHPIAPSHTNPKLNPSPISTISNPTSSIASNNNNNNFLSSLAPNTLSASVSLPSCNHNTQRNFHSILKTPEAQHPQQKSPILLQQTQHQSHHQHLLTDPRNELGETSEGAFNLGYSRLSVGRGGGGGVSNGLLGVSTTSSVPAGSVYGVEGRSLRKRPRIGGCFGLTSEENRVSWSDEVVPKQPRVQPDRPSNATQSYARYSFDTDSDIASPKDYIKDNNNNEGHGQNNADEVVDDGFLVASFKSLWRKLGF